MKRCGHYIITWVWFTILIFFLYDIIWVFANNDLVREESVDGFAPLWIDLAYSALFSFFSILVSAFIIRSNLSGKIKHRRTMTFGLILLAFNMLLAILFEKGIMDIFSEPIDDGDTLGNAYFMGLISSVVSLIFTVDHYVKMSEKRQQENADLRMQLLKMQLNPHFVFNSLSALAYLIETKPKFNCIMNHTARRTFATLMYLKGIPTISIMAITGHTTEENFMKYIKLDKSEHAKIVAKAFRE